MPQNVHLEVVSGYESARANAQPISDDSVLSSRAIELARSLDWLPNVATSTFIADRWQALLGRLKPVINACDGPLPRTPFSDDFRWLHDNVSLLASESNPGSSLAPLSEIPHARNAMGATVPRVIAVAEGFLAATKYQFNEHAFTIYVNAFQEITDLKVKELWGLIPALKLVLLEEAAERGSRLLADPTSTPGVEACIRSLREITQTTWKEALECLIVVDRVLRQDPAGVYARMDFDSRDFYRGKVINLAEHSEFSEKQVALEALALARAAQRGTHPDPR